MNVPIKEIIGGIEKAKKEIRKTKLFPNVEEQLDIFVEHAKSPILIMIMGEFSTGKSTFINALVGKKITVVDALPTTAVITKLCYGETEQVIVYKRDGSYTEYDPAEFGRLTAESDEEYNKLHESIDYVERRMPIDVLRQMNIIDSPGLNALKAAHKEATEHFINQADTVIWMISSEKAATETEYAGMEKLTARLKPIVIVNKMDLLDEDEDDSEEFISNIAEKLKDKAQTVVGISAEWAFEGKTQNNNELLEASNFSLFDKVLIDIILPGRDMYKGNSLIDELSVWLYDLMEQIQVAWKENKTNENLDYEAYVKTQENLSKVEDALAEIVQPLKNFCQESTHNASSLLLLGVLYNYGLVLSRDKERSVEVYEKSAVKNNEFAQYLIGKHFLEQDDFRKAYYWIQRSANVGLAMSQALLGTFYYNGIGVDKDIDKARELFELAGNENTAETYKFLGNIYSANENFDKAFEAYTESANKGDAEGQYLLAMCYLNGHGVKQDNEVALQWLEKSAAQNFAKAQYQLGVEYFATDLSDKDRAFQLLKSAAEQNDTDALNYLGRYYFQKDDYDNAVKYYAKSADLKNAEGCYQLSLLYSEGKGVKEDSVKALELCRTAAESGHGVAQGILAILHYNGSDLVDKDLEEAVRWALKANEKGDLNGGFVLANAYLNGTYIDKNESKGIELLEYVATNNYFEALGELGDIYSNSKYIEPNFAKASYFIAKFVLLNNKEVAFQKGFAYLYGKGVPKNIDAAEQWLKAAAECGHTLAQFNLAQIYHETKRNFEEARRWYKAAAEAGHPMAQYYFATMLAKGAGGKQDLPLAMHFWGLAADKGITDAIKQLARYYYYGGEGITPNYGLAKLHCMQLENNNQVDDFIRKILGHCYYYGYSVDKNYYIARQYYSQIDYQNLDDEIRCNLGYMYCHNLGVNAEGTGAYLENIQQQGKSMLKIAADNGYAEARTKFSEVSSWKYKIKLFIMENPVSSIIILVVMFLILAVIGGNSKSNSKLSINNSAQVSTYKKEESSVKDISRIKGYMITPVANTDHGWRTILKDRSNFSKMFDYRKEIEKNIQGLVATKRFINNNRELQEFYEVAYDVLDKRHSAALFGDDDRYFNGYYDSANNAIRKFNRLITGK